MGKPLVKTGGGLAAIRYVIRKALEIGSFWRLWKRLRSRNTCKTCALGMGGQAGGMVDESGHFPSVCKKSVQTQASDMAAPIPEEIFRELSLKRMGKMTSFELDRLGRIGFPLIAEEKDTHFRRISWEEALSRTADALKTAPPDEIFIYSSGRSSNEAAFLLQLVARAYGTSNIHNCSYYCHQASGVALGKVYGSGTASVTLEDLGQADLAIIAGANPASNHPRLLTQLMHLRRRGGKVIIINPLKELGLTRFRVPSDWRSLLFGTKMHDLYLQPHVGSDVALYKALLKGLLEAGAIERDYIDLYTSGWSAVEDDVRKARWDALIADCGVPRIEIDRAVSMLAGARKGIFCWAMGLTHQANGVENILALSNIALSRGWLGREGAGLLPIRGHSNVQGVGSCGVAPALKEAFASKLEKTYGIKVPRNPGQDTYASMVAAEQGKIRAAVLLGGNLYASNPDLVWAERALRNIPLTLTISTQLNQGHILGRGKTAIIVPALVRDEESQPTTQESMFNFVRLSDGGQPVLSNEMRSEVDIIASLAEQILPEGKFDWSRMRSHDELRKQIAQVVPGFGALEKIGENHKEFQIEGRTFHKPQFATNGGKAQFFVTPAPPAFSKPGEFRLMTLRSEGQFNTVVYEEEDLYRGNLRRDVVMMSARDARELGLEEGDRVRVQTSAGEMTVSVSIVDIRPGNLAMYYPEANVLVPRRIDPQSRTPAFKGVAARIIPTQARQQGNALAAAAG